MFRKTWEALAGAVIIAGSVLGASSAQAADLGKHKGYGSIKDSAVVARPHIGNWSGLYIGMNVGAMWDEYSSDYQRFAPVYDYPEAPKFSSADTSGMLGGHVGLQHQVGRIVVGLEAGWFGKGPFGNDWHGQNCFPTGGGYGYSCQGRLNSIMTLGPRLGLAHGNMLFYVTGGMAWGQIQTREYAPDTNVENWRWADRHAGWFVGGGSEMMLHDRWVLGIEYLHINLDSETHYQPIVPQLSRQVDADADVLRLRLSYKFGRGGAHGHTDQPLK